jgi:sec-independent protein translocase protein TatA
MFGLGPTELIVIFLLIIILFGAKRLPELARSLGSSIKEFKHATQGLKDEFDVDKKIQEKTPKQSVSSEEKKPEATEQSKSPEPKNQ